MNPIKNIYAVIVSLLCSVILFACVDEVQMVTEGDSYSIIKGDKVEIHLKVNLDNSGSDRVRTRDVNRENDGVHNPDYLHPGIGGGTLATTLIYQLYDENFNPVALPNPDSSSDLIGLHQVRVDNRKFPYSDIVFTVDNGKEYTMIFWAQSGEDGNEFGTRGDWFYETNDLKNIIVRYDTQNEDTGEGQLNNTDSRDAFCAKIKFIGGKPIPEVTLRRVMSQINIGFTPDLWKKLQGSNVDIQKSSIWIANVGRRFNLLKNQVELFSSGDATESQEDNATPTDGEEDTGKGGITWPFTMGAFNINTIPAYMEYPGRKTQEDNKLKVAGNEYKWISMCYILAPGETEEEWVDNISIANDHGSTVDIVNIQFYDKKGVAYNLPLTELLNVPVKRNYRTNIIIDELFDATITLDAQIGSDTYDDFGVNSEGIYEGELSPGLSYRISETSENGIDFFVSTVHGLKWLADRTNGLDFKIEDIPTWMIEKEGWNKYDVNKDDDRMALLSEYENRVVEIIFDRAQAKMLGNNGSLDKRYVPRNKFQYRTPWNFYGCTIYLTNDLDFNDAPESLRKDWHGFSSNVSYYNGGSTYGEWFMTEDPTVSEIDSNSHPIYKEVTESSTVFYYSTSQTNNNNGFRGTFDGQGYTIYNMTIDNRFDYYEYDEPGNRRYGPRKLHNAAFICTATGDVGIRNLRLYNAYIIGDYNMGGFVGYHASGKLTINNCRFVNSRIEGAEAQRYSPSDDANVGGIAGSLAADHKITNCQVVNSDIISTFIGAAITGIPRGYSKEYSDNSVYDTNIILTELNNVGTIGGQVPRTEWAIGGTKDPSFFFGTNDLRTTAGVSSFGDCSINAFYGIKYKPNQTEEISQSAKSGALGSSTVSNVPLELFPDILTEYAQRITMQSHITGKARTATDGMNYGLKIDVSGQPKTNTGILISNDKNGNIEKNNKSVWYFTLEGSTYNSSPLTGGSDPGDKYTRQNVLLVSADGKDNVKGLYVCAPKLPSGAERNVTVKSMIIAGEPSMEYGLYLDNVKHMNLDHVAIYDVKNAFGDARVPSGATFKTDECDFRGITNVGKGYGQVFFKNTAFNKGSGKTENVVGRLYAKSSATLDGCMFRVDYKIVVEDKDAVLTFKNCMCGPPYNQVNLTKENFWKYMDSSDQHPFVGKVKFGDDSTLYTFEELSRFQP